MQSTIAEVMCKMKLFMMLFKVHNSINQGPPTWGTRHPNGMPEVVSRDTVGENHE